MKLVSRLMAPVVAFLLGSVLGGSSARAEIFTYRDDKGTVHFSNLRDDPRWIPLRVPPSLPRRPTDRVQEYPFTRIVSAHALQNGVDAALVRAIIKVESNFEPRALSSKGAMGLMQILPETAQRYGRFNLYEPAQNIRVGVRHLRVLLALYRNDLRLTLAAYNAGTAAVTKHGGVPPFPETIAYIDRVLRHYQNFRAPAKALSTGKAGPSGSSGTE